MNLESRVERAAHEQGWDKAAGAPPHLAPREAVEVLADYFIGDETSAPCEASEDWVNIHATNEQRAPVAVVAKRWGMKQREPKS